MSLGLLNVSFSFTRHYIRKVDRDKLSKRRYPVLISSIPFVRLQNSCAPLKIAEKYRTEKYSTANPQTIIRILGISRSHSQNLTSKNPILARYEFSTRSINTLNKYQRRSDFSFTSGRYPFSCLLEIIYSFLFSDRSFV